MSSNNNETNGTAIALGLIVTGMLFLGIIIYAVLAIITFGLSVICLFALWKPRKIGKNIVTPHEARWFLGRGVIGWFALPLIISIAAQMFDWRISSDWTIHFMIAGYIIGALGGEYVIQQINEGAGGDTEPVVTTPPAQPALPRPETEAKPFRYASWDDEWKGKDAANDDQGPWQ
jgi:hypothetical protein